MKVVFMSNQSIPGKEEICTRDLIDELRRRGVAVHYATTFGERLLMLRKKNGLTQAQAAEHISVAPSSYAAYEAGKKAPKITILMKICDAYGVSADWLLGREDIA